MNLYLHATDVALVISLQGLAATAVTYRVLDAAGNELLGATGAGFTEGDTEVAVTVPALLNTLAAGVYRDIRKVELTMVAGDGTRILSELYAIEVENILNIGYNSYQTYETAELTAMFSQPLDAWDVSTKDARISSLIEAREHIGALSFTEAPLGINHLTPDEFAALTEPLQVALRRAQVIEADYIMGGGIIDRKRESGLMSETIGESSNMFRPGKSVELPVCKRCARALAGHITFAMKIGRA